MLKGTRYCRWLSLKGTVNLSLFFDEGYNKSIVVFLLNGKVIIPVLFVDDARYNWNSIGLTRAVNVLDLSKTLDIVVIISRNYALQKKDSTHILQKMPCETRPVLISCKKSALPSG